MFKVYTKEREHTNYFFNVKDFYTEIGYLKLSKLRYNVYFVVYILESWVF